MVITYLKFSSFCFFLLLLLLLTVGPMESRLVHCSLTRLIVLNPVLVSPSSPEPLHVRRRERPILAKGGIIFSPEKSDGFGFTVVYFLCIIQCVGIWNENK
jgi:hypothetical protein